MMRIMVGFLAWATGTAVALGIAWLGANVVVRNAGVGAGMPVINASVLPPSAAPAPGGFTPPAGMSPSGGARPTRSPAAARTPASGTGAPPARQGLPPSAAASAAASAGDVHAYALTGGTVTLNLAGGTAQLVTAVPDNGYSVQTWSGTGWLRVDFSSGPRVSSLIASWYLHAPTVTVEN